MQLKYPTTENGTAKRDIEISERMKKRKSRNVGFKKTYEPDFTVERVRERRAKEEDLNSSLEIYATERRRNAEKRETGEWRKVRSEMRAGSFPNTISILL